MKRNSKLAVFLDKNKHENLDMDTIMAVGASGAYPARPSRLSVACYAYGRWPRIFHTYGEKSRSVVSRVPPGTLSNTRRRIRHNSGRNL